MNNGQYRTLSKRIVDRLSVDGKDAVFWDRDLPGFGVRVYPSNAKVYVVQTRAFGRSKRVTLGRHGEVSADQARKEAIRIIARIKAGESATPAEPSAAPTVGDLAERYEREYVAMHCKPATVAHYALMLRKHIVPALGELLVAEVERKHIMAFQYGLRDMPTVANRGVDILVKMFGLADAWGWRPSGKNPCLFVRRYKVEQHHERFLTPEELCRLGQALDSAPVERLASAHAAAAIRLLVLTGCRRNEILGLRWEDLDFEAGEMRLIDSKTGARGCQPTIMAGSTDNIEAVACAVCAKTLPGDDTGEEKLAADVEIYWHIVAAELEARIVDETGEYVASWIGSGRWRSTETGSNSTPKAERRGRSRG